MFKTLIYWGFGIGLNPQSPLKLHSIILKKDKKIIITIKKKYLYNK